MSGYHDLKICPDCGRFLDPLEACTCEGVPMAEPLTDKAPQKTEPLSCPFCGSKAWATPADAKPEDGNYTVECSAVDCQATSWMCEPSYEKAVAKWNRRARLSQPSAGVDAEKAALLSRISDLESALYAVRAVSMRRHDPSWNTVTDAVNIALKGNILSAAPKPTEHSGGDAEEEDIRQCPVCAGSGSHGVYPDDGSPAECQSCGGEGRVTFRRPAAAKPRHNQS